MKKIVLLIALVIFSAALLISCAKDGSDIVTPTVDPQVTVDPTEEAALECYFSRTLPEGYAKYIKAFPEQWRVGYQMSMGYDDEQFKRALDNQTVATRGNLEESYGYLPYKVSYVFKEEIALSDEEKDTLANDLVDYSYIHRTSLNDMKKVVYTVTVYSIDAVGADTTEDTYEEEILLIYIADAGWFVSPQEYSPN